MNALENTGATITIDEEYVFGPNLYRKKAIDVLIDAAKTVYGPKQRISSPAPAEESLQESEPFATVFPLVATFPHLT